MTNFTSVPIRFGEQEVSLMKMELSDTTKALLFAKEFHFFKKHIFINFNFSHYYERFNYNQFTDNYVSKDHNVHIYLSIDNYIDEFMYDYIQKCKEATDEKVIIHIDKRDRNLKEKVERLLKDLNNWKLILETHTTVTSYLYASEYNDKTYLDIHYSDNEKTGRVQDTFHHEKPKKKPRPVTLSSRFLNRYFDAEKSESQIKHVIYAALNYYDNRKFHKEDH